ncbi:MULTISPECIES: thermonuclease family protein [Sinorhizobium]|uniref:thermonuclease family protein n=1 Tax=Sinorhizobium TaxID=28105 RepID=UPI000BE8C4CF|nr:MULTISPECIES: thermonuclease family protein [Sinorhizobium]PDT50865.1 nuclease [Sinorhizobium sp. NG07B]POH24987.1 nuclease [Sinorhizobium americanum]
MRRNALPALFAALVVIHGSAAAADYSGRARVIDGDTISIRKQRIRIAAIDACERNQTGLKDGKVWRCGVVARSYLAKIVDGQHVRCDIIDQDQYRRLVGQCFIGEIDVGLAMVKAGLAEAMLRYLPANHSISAVEYGEAENSARDHRFGMWSAEIESPHVYRRSKTTEIP